MWFCHLLHTERSLRAYWFSAVIVSSGHDLPSDARAFSFTFFEMQSSSLRLNKGFRLSDFLKSASWIWKIFIQLYSFVTESDGFLKVLSRWAQHVSVFSRMLNSQGEWFRDANFWRMDWSLNWSYINYGDKNCVVTRWKNGKKNLHLKENLTGSCHFSNLRHICGDSFHTLQSPRVSREEMKIYERSLQALLSLPHPPLPRLPSRATHACTFHDSPQMESLLAGYKRDNYRPKPQHILYDQYGMSVFCYWGTDLWPISHTLLISYDCLMEM